MGKIRPAFLPLVLALCLALAAASTLFRPLGPASLLLAVLVVAAARLLAPWVAGWSNRRLAWVVAAVLAAALVGQLAVLVAMPDTVYHDPFRVLAQADRMAAGLPGFASTYFWRYANNVPLAFLLAQWLRLTAALGLSANAAVHLLSLLTLDGFIALSLLTVWQLSHRPTVVVGTLAFLALTPFAYTYYLQVAYSDLPTLLVLLMILRQFWRWPELSGRGRRRAGALLLLAVLLGALLKPNLIVLLPALAILAALLWRRQRGPAAGRQRAGAGNRSRAENAQRSSSAAAGRVGSKTGRHFHPGTGRRRGRLPGHHLGLPILLVCLGFALTPPVTSAIQRASGYTANDAYAMPVTNWIAMGVNAAHRGTYAGPDVGAAIALPTKAARNRHAVNLILTRVRRLGPGGLLKLWLVKLGVLLNPTSIQDWYNGGFRAAPAWYLRHAAFFRAATALSYTVTTLALWLTLGLRLLAWRPDLTRRTDVVAALAVITALGYLAFHVLLWEVEGRYGQVLVPLALVAWAALPAPARQRHAAATKTPAESSEARGDAAGNDRDHVTDSGDATGIAAPVVVTAQRSQHSTQYGARPARLIPGTVTTQDVTLNGPANYFSVQGHSGTGLTVTLTHLATGTRWPLHREGTVFRLRRPLTAGRYRITVTNASGRTQPLDVVGTQRLRLAAAPLITNGFAEPTASLIYTCLAWRKTNG